jgi:hypothetical protein
MLRRKLLFGLQAPVKFNPVPYRHFCTPEKPPKKDSPEDFEINISPKVIKRTLIGVVTVSWLLLLKLWFGFEESTRNRATEYYEQGGSMDPSPPEEYRKEYVI